jgi:hypothetical protein
MRVTAAGKSRCENWEKRPSAAKAALLGKQMWHD